MKHYYFVALLLYGHIHMFLDHVLLQSATPSVNTFSTSSYITLAIRPTQSVSRGHFEERRIMAKYCFFLLLAASLQSSSSLAQEDDGVIVVIAGVTGEDVLGLVSFKNALHFPHLMRSCHYSFPFFSTFPSLSNGRRNPQINKRNWNAL